MRFLSGEFFQRVIRVFLGTLGAQAITIGSMLVLVRLYTPAEMGHFNVWVSFVTIGVVAATGRYELAMFAIKSGHEAKDIVKLIGHVAFWFAVASGGVLYILGQTTDMVPLGVVSFLPALAVAIFVMALQKAFGNVLVLHRQFARLGISRVAAAASVALLQFAGAWALSGSAGLIYGQTLGIIAGTALLLLLIDRQWLSSCLKSDMKRTLRAARKYAQFPKFSLPADLINTLVAQLPLILMSSRYGADVVGWYGMTTRAMAAPISLLSNSVLDVFKEQAARDYREKGDCRDVYRRTFLTLALIALPPFTILWLFSEVLFSFVFGETWRQSGVYARLLIPMFYMGFIVSPLGYTIYIAQKQHYDLVWQLGGLGVALASFLLPSTPEQSIGIFSVSYAGMYAIYLGMSYYFSRNRKSGA
ncbi:oligosaccharide flippase family protein [Achromobacter mucicolens]|uniref:lipopolysaccharide biosynthesis protein n=1 Tax=Achromobacter mucicolens TaxID=1389922 RepID=UPI00244CAD3E|nr:oligosaccharide flippase family protein [Achromobacter mucicolens]MDH0089870.1 oligosaccharide flippase family protein [Achromobacter mucicolens]